MNSFKRVYKSNFFKGIFKSFIGHSQLYSNDIREMTSRDDDGKFEWTDEDRDCDNMIDDLRCTRMVNKNVYVYVGVR